VACCDWHACCGCPTTLSACKPRAEHMLRVYHHADDVLCKHHRAEHMLWACHHAEHKLRVWSLRRVPAGGSLASSSCKDVSTDCGLRARPEPRSSSHPSTCCLVVALLQADLRVEAVHMQRFYDNFHGAESSRGGRSSRALIPLHHGAERSTAARGLGGSTPSPEGCCQQNC
jgi:hypothetical protein